MYLVLGLNICALFQEALDHCKLVEFRRFVKRSMPLRTDG
jgi:hypothetical protein